MKLILLEANCSSPLTFHLSFQCKAHVSGMFGHWRGVMQLWSSYRHMAKVSCNFVFGCLAKVEEHLNVEKKRKNVVKKGLTEVVWVVMGDFQHMLWEMAMMKQIVGYV